MNNTLSEVTRHTKFNTNRSEISKDQKSAAKNANGTSQQLASSGFDSSQITSVLDKVTGNLHQRPWGDCCDGKPSFESAIGQSVELKPSIDLKPLLDTPPKPISTPGGLLDIIKPGIEKPVKPFPEFPFPVKPVGPGLFPQPEVELADPGLTDVHTDLFTDGIRGNEVMYEDVDGDIVVGTVDISDVDQGKVADCYLLAVLGSIALHNPEYIENMITDNGDGTYTVSFGGELGDVTVDDDFAMFADGEIAYAQMGDESNPELWVAIIEKAYVQANLNTENGNVRDGTFEGIGFGSSAIAMENITGQSSTSGEPTAFTPESLQAALANGQSVIMGTLGATDKKTQTPDGLWRSHAYVLTDVRMNSKGQWEVTIYNPHGSDHHGTPQDPYTTMTLEQFNTNFRSVIVTDEPVG